LELSSGVSRNESEGEAESKDAPGKQHASAIASPEFTQLRLLGQQNSPVEHAAAPAGQLVDARDQPTPFIAAMIFRARSDCQIKAVRIDDAAEMKTSCSKSIDSYNTGQS
jgi:hypothetical protein